MDPYLWPLLAFVPFFALLIWHGLRVRSCPECGGPLYGLQSPLTKTHRQWVEGGYLCRRCGGETDLAGVRVPAGTGPRRGAMLMGVALVAAAVVPAVVLGALLLD